MDIKEHILIVYGCFVKGCPTKEYKCTQQCRKVLWVVVVNCCLVEANWGFSVNEGNSTLMFMFPLIAEML